MKFDLNIKYNPERKTLTLSSTHSNTKIYNVEDIEDLKNSVIYFFDNLSSESEIIEDDNSPYRCIYCNNCTVKSVKNFKLKPGCKSGSPKKHHENYNFIGNTIRIRCNKLRKGKSFTNLQEALSFTTFSECETHNNEMFTINSSEQYITQFLDAKAIKNEMFKSSKENENKN